MEGRWTSSEEEMNRQAIHDRFWKDGYVAPLPAISSRRARMIFNNLEALDDYGLGEIRHPWY